MRSTLRPGRMKSEYFQSDFGANSGMPKVAGRSMARCRNAPASTAANPEGPARTMTAGDAASKDGKRDAGHMRGQTSRQYR